MISRLSSYQMSASPDAHMQADFGKPHRIPAKRGAFAFQLGRNLRVVTIGIIGLAFVLVALAFTLALRKPPMLTIDVGGPDDERFINGVLPPQKDEVSGLAFRWTKPTAQLRLHGTAFAPIELALHMHSNDSPSARQLRLKYGDRLLSTTTLMPGWRTYYTALPAIPSDATLQAAALTLESDPLAGATDNVQRGVALDWVRVQPLRSSALPWRAFALSCALAVLAGWLWVADTLLFVRTARWRWLRVASMIGILTLLLLWWAIANPYTLAWALPNLPWSLGIATLGLAAIGFTQTVQPRQARLPRLALAISALIAGQALLYSQSSILFGGVLVLLGIALLLGIQGWADLKQTQAQLPWLNSHVESIALGIIFLIALGVRLYHVAELPYGLWQDEARHGLEALHILHDPNYRPAYIGGHVDLPGFGMYPFALAMWLWGPHIWSMRIITGLAGALTVFPMYGLTRRLYGRGTIALLAAALLACSNWHLTISRFSFPTIFDPLLQLSGLWLLAVGLEARGHMWLRGLALLLAGVCLGLALQTYHTGRLAPVFAGLLALFLLARAPHHWRWWLGGGSIALIGLALAISTFVGYALQHPDIFNQRVSAVALLGRSDSQYSNQAPLAVLDMSFGRHVLMFNVHGDDNGRQNEPGRAMLDFITGIGFLVGVVFCLRDWHDWRNWFVLLALALGLLPSLLSVDSPHAMRGIDALPYACLIAALGFSQLGRLCAAVRPANQPLAPRTWLSAGVGLVGLVFIGTCWIYFVSMPNNPEVWTSFYPVQTQAGIFVEQLASQRGKQDLDEVYIQEKIASNPVFAYLANGLHFHTLEDTRRSQAAQSGALFIVSGYTTPQDIHALVTAQQLEPAPFLVGPQLPNGNTPSFIVYRKM